MKGNPHALSQLSWLLLLCALGTLLFTFASREDYAHVALLDDLASSEEPVTVFELNLSEARMLRQVVCFSHSDGREEFVEALGSLELRWINPHGEAVVTSPLGESRQAPTYDEGRRCAEISGVPLVGGEYRVELAGEADGVDTTSVGVLVLESTPMQLPERLSVLGLLLAMFLKLLSWNYRDPPAEGNPRRRNWQPWDPMLGVGLVIAGSIAVSLVLGGNPMTSVKQFRETGGLDPEVLGTSDLGGDTWAILLLMLASAAVYLAGARGMARLRDRDTSAILHTHAPRRIHVSVAAMAGVAMAIGASLLLHFWTPDQSSRMQLQTLVPALTLATAVVACLAPWYEELFFRGFLFSSIEKLTTGLVAVVVVTALFTLAHLGQHVGFLIPLIPIFGVALTTSLLRWLSGSTTAAFALHLGYNATLVLPVLLM